MPGKNAMWEFFKGRPTKDLLAERRPVITVKSTDSIEHVVKVLGDNKILSAPVLDDNKEPIGFVDMLDIVSYIIKCAPHDTELKADELESLKIAGRAISLVPVTNAIDASRRDALFSLFEEAPASECVEAFASGIHRVVLFNNAGNAKEITGVVTQADVNHFLNKHIGYFKPQIDEPLMALGYATNAVVSVASSDSVYTALRTMDKNQVSAVAVVDRKTGRLVGNFSASNLIGLYRQNFPHLLDHVSKYLEEHSPASLKPIAVLPTTSLATVISELSQNNLHHLWILDDFKPVGIVSLTDVMKMIVLDRKVELQ